MTYFERLKEIFGIASKLSVSQLASVVAAYGEAAIKDITDSHTPEEAEIIIKRKLECQGCGLCTNLSTCNSGLYGDCVKQFFYRANNELRLAGNSYNGCGCGLHVKQSTMSAQCPLGKWEFEQ